MCSCASVTPSVAGATGPVTVMTWQALGCIGPSGALGPPAGAGALVRIVLGERAGVFAGGSGRRCRVQLGSPESIRNPMLPEDVGDRLSFFDDLGRAVV